MYYIWAIIYIYIYIYTHTHAHTHTLHRRSGLWPEGPLGESSLCPNFEGYIIYIPLCII